jgi:nicotinamidase-related amidase
MINDFVHGKPPNLPATPEKERVVKGCLDAIEAARSFDIPVIYANDLFTPHEMLTTVEYEVWGEHAIAGTKGAEIIKEITPSSKDFEVHKKRYSAFPGTQLDLLLRELGVQEVVVIGVQTDCCVQHTVSDSFVHTYSTTVLDDACDTLTQEDHRRALEYMKKFYRSKVTSVAEWINSLNEYKKSLLSKNGFEN